MGGRLGVVVGFHFDDRATHAIDEKRGADELRCNSVNAAGEEWRRRGVGEGIPSDFAGCARTRCA
jgi:hypothetical protein